MKFSSLPLVLAGLALSGCTGPVIMGTDAAVTVATKSWGSPAADTQDQIPPHESWCYSTMGDSECFAHAQDVQPNRLINVDPQSRYPVDAATYRRVVAADKMVAMSSTPSTAPTALTPAPTLEVEKNDEMGTLPMSSRSNLGDTSKMP